MDVRGSVLRWSRGGLTVRPEPKNENRPVLEHQAVKNRELLAHPCNEDHGART